MNLTNNQKAELAILLWFGDNPKASDDDIQKFFDYSDKGIGRSDAERALSQPKDFNPGFIALMKAKKYRDLQISEWKMDWGSTLNAWSFLDEPLYIVEWIAKRLDREAIIKAWRENKVNEHRRAAYKYNKIIENKPFNKTMGVSRSYA